MSLALGIALNPIIDSLEFWGIRQYVLLQTHGPKMFAPVNGWKNDQVRSRAVTRNKDPHRCERKLYHTASM